MKSKPTQAILARPAQHRPYQVGQILSLKGFAPEIAVKFLSVTSLPKNNQANLDRFSFGIKIVNSI